MAGSSHRTRSRWRAPCLALAVGCLLFPAAASAAHQFNAIMIYASDERAPLDRRLEHIEYKLRRVFGFRRFFPNDVRKKLLVKKFEKIVVFPPARSDLPEPSPDVALEINSKIFFVCEQVLVVVRA